MSAATREPSLFEATGNYAIAFFTFIGECALILRDAVVRVGRRPFEIGETINQMAFVGVASIPIVVLTGFFSGAVISLYLTSFLSEYRASAFVGATVGLTVTREIGPVLAGIMVAARCGSAMAAQIASMAVTEQIDALRMLSVHPTNYLVLPRVIAAVLMEPVLALMTIWAGIVGGLIVAVSEGLTVDTFMQSLIRSVHPSDFINGCLKGPVFGLIIAIVACQQGLRTTNGAVGVGRATTNTVVISMVLIYVANFLLAMVMFS